MNFEIFCLHVNGYLNTKESFPICMFVVMASGKYELHTYLTFLQRILTSTHMKIYNIFLHNTRSVRIVSDRIFVCEHLMDYNLARLHEPTLNLSANA